MGVRAHVYTDPEIARLRHSLSKMYGKLLWETEDLQADESLTKIATVFGNSREAQGHSP